MMDAIYKRMNDDLEVVTGHTEESQIQKFYAGKTVFLTGSTGFMGKALVEKLLRGCPDLKCIYVMIRPRKGLSVAERMKKLFSDVVFDPLRKMYPDFESKVHAVEGDLAKEDLGLSEKDKNIIIEETNIIIHNASNVKFIVRMKEIGRVNVLGTAMTIDLALKCKHIEGFMYVSTAYSHCYQQNIKEEAYPPPGDLNMIMNLVGTDENTPTGISETDLKQILGKFPNLYTYTKSVAEGLVSDIAKKAPFPCIIYRPAMVISSWKEPLQAWIDNVNGPALAMIAYALGILHTAYMRSKITDFVPVDMTINALIASIWDVVKNRPKNADVFVYNYGSSTVNKTNLSVFKHLCVSPESDIPQNYSIHTVWPRFLIETTCFWNFLLLNFIFHFVPAIFVDAYLFVTGKKTMAVSMAIKGSSHLSILRYFITAEWLIDITETNKAVDRMNSADRDLFFCDVRKLDWVDYSRNYWNGLRLYILKDPMSTVPAGMQKYYRLQCLQYTLIFAFLSYAVYFIVTRLGLI